MRILANENFPLSAVQAMRAAGHDVLWIRESMPGTSDPVILRLALEQARILVTFDKDFGELAFRARLPASCGVVLFRIRKQHPELLAGQIASFINSRNDWPGHFSVIEEDRVRMTALPGTDPGTVGKVGPA